MNKLLNRIYYILCIFENKNKVLFVYEIQPLTQNIYLLFKFLIPIRLGRGYHKNTTSGQLHLVLGPEPRTFD